MRMNKTLSTIMSLSLLLGTTGAFAASDQDGMETESTPGAVQQTQQSQGAQDMSAEFDKMFKKLDTNHDGMIDKKEAKANKALNKDFKKIAKNGKLDQEGYGKWEQSHKHMAN